MAVRSANEWILETIDHLRKRKARPDLERICHMVRRTRGLSADKTEEEIKKLVKEGTVVKVDYKGSISYRNAAKYKRKLQTPVSQLKGDLVHEANEDDLVNAIKLLKTEKGAGVKQTKESTENADASVKAVTMNDVKANRHEAVFNIPQCGFSVDELHAYMKRLDSSSDVTKSSLETSLEKLLKSGKVCKLSNGGYALNDMEKKVTGVKLTVAVDSLNVASTSSAAAKPSPPKRGRPPGGGIGKFKKSVDEPPKCEPALKRPKRDGGSVSDLMLRRESNSSAIAADVLARCQASVSSNASEVEDVGVSLSVSLKDKKGSSADEKPEAEDAVTSLMSDASDDNNHCDYCGKTSSENKEGRPEEFLVCKDCSNKAHPSCMSYQEDLAVRARRSPWQCIYCKTCNICQDAGDADEMLVCDSCDKGYHMKCHKPPVDDKPTGSWVCNRCSVENEIQSKMSDDESNSSTEVEDLFSDKELRPKGEGGSSCAPLPGELTSLPESRDSKSGISPLSVNTTFPVLCTTNALPKLANTVNYEVPDATDWTPKDVTSFFTKVGFLAEAEVFQEQEIDGKSLLLMKRSDVLQGLSLKLGPALKIYAHVQRLQTK